MVNEMRTFIISKTKIEKSLMKKYQDRDWYLEVNDQVKLGVVDEIISDIDCIL